MNNQYFGNRYDPSGVVEKPDGTMTKPPVNSDSFADEVPADESILHETPMGGTVAAVSPMNETPVHVDEIPQGETGDMVLVDETKLHEAPILVEPVPYQVPVVDPTPFKAAVIETNAHETPTGTNIGSTTALLNHEESEHYRTRWNEIQGTFVDEPRTAVQQADELVSEVIGQITKMFANNHSMLESQWKQGNDVSTEDLRKALQQYRTFFNRLVV